MTNWRPVLIYLAIAVIFPFIGFSLGASEPIIGILEVVGLISFFFFLSDKKEKKELIFGFGGILIFLITYIVLLRIDKTISHALVIAAFVILLIAFLCMREDRDVAREKLERSTKHPH